MFQSLIGRLRTLSGEDADEVVAAEFQSLLGRLRTRLAPASFTYYHMFQSLIGRLRTQEPLPIQLAPGLVSIPHR